MGRAGTPTTVTPSGRLPITQEPAPTVTSAADSRPVDDYRSHPQPNCNHPPAPHPPGAPRGTGAPRHRQLQSWSTVAAVLTMTALPDPGRGLHDRLGKNHRGRPQYGPIAPLPLKGAPASPGYNPDCRSSVVNSERLRLSPSGHDHVRGAPAMDLAPEKSAITG